MSEDRVDRLQQEIQVRNIMDASNKAPDEPTISDALGHLAEAALQLQVTTDPGNHGRSRKPYDMLRAAFTAQDQRTITILGESGHDPENYFGQRVLLKPEFEKARPEDYSDWRNLIPPIVRGFWLLLPPDARAALFLTAFNSTERAMAFHAIRRADASDVLSRIYRHLNTDQVRRMSGSHCYCHCNYCVETVEARGIATCATCEYTGRFVTQRCDCMMRCPGGPERNEGCFHGELTCPVCQYGNTNAWLLIREMRKMIGSPNPA